MKKRFCYVFKSPLRKPSAVKQVDGGYEYTYDKPYEAPVAKFRVHWFHANFLLRSRLAEKYKGHYAYIFDHEFQKPHAKAKGDKAYTFKKLHKNALSWFKV